MEPRPLPWRHFSLDKWRHFSTRLTPVQLKTCIDAVLWQHRADFTFDPRKFKWKCRVYRGVLQGDFRVVVWAGAVEVLYRSREARDEMSRIFHAIHAAASQIEGCPGPAPRPPPRPPSPAELGPANCPFPPPSEAQLRAGERRSLDLARSPFGTQQLLGVRGLAHQLRGSGRAVGGAAMEVLVRSTTDWQDEVRLAAAEGLRVQSAVAPQAVLHHGGARALGALLRAGSREWPQERRVALDALCALCAAGDRARVAVRGECGEQVLFLAGRSRDSEVLRLCGELLARLSSPSRV